MPVCFRHIDRKISRVFHIVISIAGDAAQISSAGTAFRHIADRLFFFLRLRQKADHAKAHLANAFRFIDEAYGADGQETLIFVTELTMNFHTAAFIKIYGSDEYFAHNKGILLYEREKDILKQIEEL